MDREIILEHLAQAERLIAESSRRIAQQRMEVERLEEEGADSATARILLLEFEYSLALHRADRERLQGKLQTTEPWCAASVPESALEGATLQT